MTIADWPIHERPREKLLRLGAPSLSEAELLAIFLQTGIKGKTAVDLGRELLQEFKSLNHLFTASENQLKSFPGLGKAKYSMFQAVLELGRRCLEETVQLNSPLTHSNHVKHYLISKLGNCRNEVFSCIFLNNRHYIIQYKELFFGTINCAPIYPRVVAQKALEYNAAAVIFAHNHPSGEVDPSQDDIAATKKLINVLSHLDIRVLDHIIVGGNQCKSLAEEGLI